MTGVQTCALPISILNARGLEHAVIRVEDAKSLWDGEAFWHVEDASKFDDWIAPDAAPFGVIHENLSARINPRLACKSLSKALRLKGCEILERWEMVTIDDNARSEEHTSELQSRRNLVCRLLLEKKKTPPPPPPLIAISHFHQPCTH